MVYETKGRNDGLSPINIVESRYVIQGTENNALSGILYTLLYMRHCRDRRKNNIITCYLDSLYRDSTVFINSPIPFFSALNQDLLGSKVLDVFPKRQELTMTNNRMAFWLRFS